MQYLLAILWALIPMCSLAWQLRLVSRFTSPGRPHSRASNPQSAWNPSSTRIKFTNIVGMTAAFQSDAAGVLERIYGIVGRKFDISKPSILAKVLYDDLQVLRHPSPSTQTTAASGRAKSRSVSISTLSAALKVEEDPRTRELLMLVLQWLEEKALAKRGGFLAAGSKVADMPEWRSRLIPDHDQLPADTSGLPTILIDGHYIIFRSFYAMPALTTRDGTPVGALLGFCNVINELVVKPWADGSEPKRRVVVALDTGKDNFRHDLYPAYKAERKEVPNDLTPQFALIQRACEAYGLETMEGAGFEADDVIASLALEAVTSGATDVTIVSADKDLAQLVTRRVNMLNIYTGERMGPDDVLAKFLAPPGRLADLLAIAGDKADGVPGASGYGPVTAAKVLAKWATLEEAVDEICSTLAKKDTDEALIEETRAQVMMARRLVDLRTDVPLDKRSGPKTLSAVAPFQLEAGQGTARLFRFMKEFELNDLARRTSRILGVGDD